MLSAYIAICICRHMSTAISWEQLSIAPNPPHVTGFLFPWEFPESFHSSTLFLALFRGSVCKLGLIYQRLALQTQINKLKIMLANCWVPPPGSKAITSWCHIFMPHLCMISHSLSGPCFLRGFCVTELPSELWCDLTERQHWFTNYLIQQKQT